MPKSLFRAFVAIEIPDSVRNTISALIGRLRERDATNCVRWVRPEGLHVTLKFLGHTPDDKERVIESALESAAAIRPGFDLWLGPLGSFRSRRGARDQVVWVGLSGETAQLLELAADVDRALVAVGFPAETRPFTPHLTLGRMRRGVRSAPSFTEDAAWPPGDGAFHVGHLSLMESDLRPDGARYTRRLHTPLSRSLRIERPL